jgi:hypothetical protein
MRLLCVDFGVIKLHEREMMMPTTNETVIPPALAAVAQGRDYIRTSEFAHAMSRATQTVLKNHCITGECFGLRPIKRGKLLLWSVAGIAQILSGGQ